MPKLDFLEKMDHEKRIPHQISLVSAYLKDPPKQILDIGCGPAEHARMFQEKFDSELWLVEGDKRNNSKKLSSAVKSKFRSSTEDFLYYWDLRELKEKLDGYGLENYHLIDCERTQIIPTNTKFDLVCSWKSCGYHYPLNSYADLIKKHSHPGTVIVMDIRLIKGVLQTDQGWRIIKELYQHGDKYVTCLIEFV